MKATSNHNDNQNRKKRFRDRWQPLIIAWLLSLYVYLVYKTSKIDYLNKAVIDEMLAQEIPFIIVVWHQHIPFFPWMFHGIKNPQTGKKQKYTGLTVPHRDSKMLSHTIKLFGNDYIEYEKERPSSLLPLLKSIKKATIVTDTV